MNDQDDAILKRLHDAVNREIGKRLQANIELSQLRKKVEHLERELAGNRELFQALNRAAQDKTLGSPGE